MPIRISGMISGMDTDAMVKELVSAYQTKTDKYKKAQTKLEWKQDAWKELNSKIYKLYTNMFSRTLSSNYNKKKTVSSDESKASVVAANGSVIGTQTLKINKLAKSGYLTGAEIETKSGEHATADTTLSELGITDATSFKIKVGKEEQTIELTGSMKIGDLVKELNKTGVTASFDEKNQRFFISSKSSGGANNFEIDSDDTQALEALGLKYSTKDSENVGSKEAHKVTGTDAEIEIGRASCRERVLHTV